MNRRILLATSLAILVPACAAQQEDAEGASADAISKPDLQARFADLRKIDTRNLSGIAMNLGAKGLNSALSVKSKYVELGVAVAETNVFAKDAEQNSLLPAGKVKSIGGIKAALATELGEREFPTELASVRLAHLEAGADTYFVETGFGIRGAAGIALNHDAGGFGESGGAQLQVGFKKGAELEARVVVATPAAQLGDLISANGEAIATLRAGQGGFIVPESTEQILSMKPGEMVGLKGKGTYAANFGLGVPILIANAGPFAYTVAVSAGLTHAVEGVLDVALVRLDGDVVVVDVGISEATLDQKSLGLRGSWGVPHDCDDGSPCLDGPLGSIVGKGLGKRLGAFMTTSVAASSAQRGNRLELARARFHVNQPEVAGALQQALHGDLRYAQALSSRSLDEAEPAVKFDFDMMRASMTSTRSFGAEVFGIDIYHRVAVEKSGAFAVQSPDGVQSVLWSSFEKRGGWYQMDHGSKLTAISSAALDARNPDRAVNRASFIVQSVVGDTHMDDDVLLDSSDALIATVAGAGALAPLDKYGTPMQQAVGRACPLQNVPGSTSDRKTWDEACNVELIEDETRTVVDVDGARLSLVEARKRGVAEFTMQQSLASLPQGMRDVLATAAELRLTLQMVKVNGVGSSSGPGVSFALDYRLDDQALALLANADEAAYAEIVRRYLTTVGAARTGIDTSDPITTDRIEKAALAMVGVLQRFKTSYRNLAENESQDLPRLLAGKPYVNLPIGIRFDVSDVADANSAERMKQFVADASRIRVESISHQRALLGKQLFDGLAAAAEKSVGFGNFKQRLFAEQAAAYPLVALVPADHLDLGIDLAADVQSTFWNKRERFIKAGFRAASKSAHGSQVEPIASKLFDIDTMMSAR